MKACETHDRPNRPLAVYALAFTLFLYVPIMLAGFEGVASVEIVIDGQPMEDVPPHHRPINMVFQKYAIFPRPDVRYRTGSP